MTGMQTGKKTDVLSLFYHLHNLTLTTILPELSFDRIGGGWDVPFGPFYSFLYTRRVP
jgi:hypothetical protein